MLHKSVLTAFFVILAPVVLAQTPATLDSAAAFGARPSVLHLSLSPDGKSVAYLAPTKGQGTIAYTLSLDGASKPRVALTADGKPNRLERCDWVANDRLICEVYGLVTKPDLLWFTRLIAVDVGGGNPQLISTRDNGAALLGGGAIVDWLPGGNGSVLMTRTKMIDTHGTHLGSDDHGLRVERVDTRTLAATVVEKASANAVFYLSDNAGVVRVMATANVRGATGQSDGSQTYLYRRSDSRQWETLSTYNFVTRAGFRPVAIDREHDVVYGMQKKDGRLAVYTVALDGSLSERLVYAREDVDIDHLLLAGRQRRVVGASYATDYRSNVYFDKSAETIANSLSAALKQRVGIVDSSLDESRWLVFSSRDDDPGVYYLFDRPDKHLQTFLVVRGALEGVKLATVRPVTYTASDGAKVPGYLTLPPGMDSAKGLPAIVMPHGGPSARDEWGFDWLSQYFAARGFAVLQPNFRGSVGYGDGWFRENGFKAWPTAIGDVVDGGRWLIGEQGADPAKLAIVGWSYGGYAALQSSVVEPDLFKAVIAIAPVTDLPAMKEEHRFWNNYRLVEEMIGEGPHVKAGSPAQNASKIKAPVMLFHGTADLNVAYGQSQLMDKSLASAGVKHELVTYDGLDHQLEDSDARADLLRRSDAFLRQTLGL